jgi:hypothetical protein
VQYLDLDASHTTGESYYINHESWPWTGLSCSVLFSAFRTAVETAAGRRAPPLAMMFKLVKCCLVARRYVSLHLITLSQLWRGWKCDDDFS